MANLRIQEFRGLGSGRNDDAQVLSTPPNVEQAPVAIGVSSAQSAAFAEHTTLVWLQAEAICAIYVGGTNPVATAGTSTRLVAGQSIAFRVVKGDKLAVIQDT